MKSQFSHGVLGFFFKIASEAYFRRDGVDDFHDRFLNTMVEEGDTNIDMTLFV
jgi:hypothetical protein